MALKTNWLKLYCSLLREKKNGVKKKKQKQETTHTYIRTKMHTPFEPQSYVTHLLPTQTPFTTWSMISLIDILQKYLCVIHGSSTVYQDDDGVMLCDGLVHETTRFTSQLPQYVSKNFSALECNLQRVFSHTFLIFPWSFPLNILQ